MKRPPIRTLRTLVQSGFAAFCLFAGYQFYHFYLWAMGESEVYVPRPPSVEGFLPISALLGLKRLMLTGRYDEIHPAGLTIFLSALIIALLLRKGFCGWICPVGFCPNLIEKLEKGSALSGACRHGLTTPSFLSSTCASPSFSTRFSGR